MTVERQIMLPKATVEHAMPGRLRVRIPELRHDASYFRSTVEKLAKHPEISALWANPVTASIVIQHQADLPAIRDIATKSEVFDLQEAPSSSALRSNGPTAQRPNGRSAQRRFSTANEKAATLATGDAASIGLMSLSALQAMRGYAVGPASENFWNAFGALRILNNPMVALVFGGLGLLQVMRGRWAGSATSLLFYAFAIRQIAGAGPRQDGRPNGPEHGRQAVLPQQ
ncbi:hypothetical protein SAZ10_31895 [Mesorhizobium sp. BAC0120]|uniref:HMA2 domain-containing protein n=1 Tax=Mesorhizobium sp. BAC0120 TaxID=3090670 RepID=UPI00298BF174|nr:hypothetical protein [Mesorhizobium sp. BAC0120]MDW6026373.1 hypothetical protein [Mesorhizobium sp. BAC0120]